MEGLDRELERRVRDVVAVVTEDIDAVTCEVEDGVAYIEGVVPSERERRLISRAVSRIEGLTQVITCLSTERVMPSPCQQATTRFLPRTIFMQNPSLS